MWSGSGRGHDIYIFDSNDIQLPPENVQTFFVPAGRFDSIDEYWRTVLQIVQFGDKRWTGIQNLDVIWYRKNPPFEREKVLSILSFSGIPFTVNDFRGLLKAADKRYILEFPDLIPATRIVYCDRDLHDIAGEFRGEVVVKPLDGFGGDGIHRIGIHDLCNIEIRNGSPLMVQEFLPEVGKGDIRILMLNGEVVGAMRRLPVRGEFRSNVKLGGTVTPHILDSRELEVCTSVADRLRSDGLYFVGLDLIDGRLIEINCLSPGGIPRINMLNNDCLQHRALDFIEVYR